MSGTLKIGICFGASSVDPRGACGGGWLSAPVVWVSSCWVTWVSHCWVSQPWFPHSSFLRVPFSLLFGLFEVPRTFFLLGSPALVSPLFLLVGALSVLFGAWGPRACLLLVPSISSFVEEVGLDIADRLFHVGRVVPDVKALAKVLWAQLRFSFLGDLGRAPNRRVPFARGP